MTNQQNMDTQKTQDKIAEFEKVLTKCLLDFDDKGAKEAYSKIRHIKKNQPQQQEDKHFQELLDKCSDDYCEDYFYLRGRIGACYLYGSGIKKDEDTGVKLLKEASTDFNCMTAYSDLDCYFEDKMEATFLKNLKAFPEIYSEGCS